MGPVFVFEEQRNRSDLFDRPDPRKPKDALRARFGGDAQLQLKRAPSAHGEQSAELMAHWAESGATGAGAPLPHLDLIQQAFGEEHDLSAIQAHVGGSAAEAAANLGAEAYATGNTVAFAGAPDLHTAAHEAAHVVQQRAGVQCKGGLGGASDEHERKADAIADRVVAGDSVADLLPKAEGPIRHEGPAEHKPVQRKAISHDVDTDELESNGKDFHLDGGKAKAAVAANNKRWQGNYKKELLGFLRGDEDQPAGAVFNEADVQYIAKLQAGAGTTADGIIGDGTMAVLLAAGMKFGDDVQKDKAHPSGKVKPWEVQIEFWPGELEDLGAWDEAIKQAESESAASGDDAPFRHLNAPEGVGKLYIKVNGKLVAAYSARGGPPRKIRDMGGHTADPTQGNFTVGAQQNGFTTSSWAMSQIPWGAHVRKGAGGYEFEREGSTKWEKDPGAVDDDTFAQLPPIPGAGSDERMYNQNDFGKMAFRLQGSPGFYLHTTPETEEQAALGEEVELSHSHGCVHLDPNERDEMIARGYLQAGVKFTIKKYEQHLLPNKMRDDMMGK
jgi:hypothetical protein